MLRLFTVVAAAVASLTGSGDVAAAGIPAPVPCTGRCWRPPVETTFTWQLQGTVRPGRVADVYDVDAVDVPAATVRELHRRGRKVVCYVNAGAWEAWRPDAAAFPEQVLGSELAGWPGERWLDIRRAAVRPILRARVDACAAQGFDGIEFDNVDAYTHPTGFPLTAGNQITFNRWLADEAHRHGLAVGLKNDTDQVIALVRWFDFAVVEQCFQYRECARYSPFIRAGKPVFIAEYDLPLARFCGEARRLRMSAARYPLLLDGRRWACRWPG